MTTVETTRTAPLGAVSTFRAVNAVENVYHALVKWNMERQTRKSLSMLSDHELDDIGLSRGDIGAITASFTRSL